MWKKSTRPSSLYLKNLFIATVRIIIQQAVCDQLAVSMTSLHLLSLQWPVCERNSIKGCETEPPGMHFARRTHACAEQAACAAWTPEERLNHHSNHFRWHLTDQTRNQEEALLTGSTGRGEQQKKKGTKSAFQTQNFNCSQWNSIANSVRTHV